MCSPWCNTVSYLSAKSRVLLWEGKTMQSTTKIQLQSLQLQIAWATNHNNQTTNHFFFLLNVTCTMHFCAEKAILWPCSYRGLLSLTGDKAVTRMKRFKLLFAPFDPSTQTAFHRLKQQIKALWGTFSRAKVSLINYIHHKIEENIKNFERVCS